MPRATEAALACLALATGPIGAAQVVAIIHPDNLRRAEWLRSSA